MEDWQKYLDLGDIHQKQSEIAESVNCYLKSLDIYPDFFETHDRLWNLLNYYEIPSEVLERIVCYYEIFIKKIPDFFSAYTILGDALTKQEKIPAAIGCYQQANLINSLKSKPDFVDKYWKLSKPANPSFIIIGCQKCGTTSLYQYLNVHPQILPTFQKEVRFFSWSFMEGQAGKDWYLAHFPPLPDGQKFLTGEASPEYIYYPGVEKRIFEFCPQIKLIVMLRNPVERSISDYYHHQKYGAEFRSLEQALEPQIKILKQAAANEIEINDELLDQMQPNYLLNSVYIYFLEKWMSWFPREQLLVLATEDLDAAPERTMKEVYEFLGVSVHELSDYPRHNSNSYPRVSDSIRQSLAECFQPYNQKLEKYLGRKFNW